MLRAYGTLSLIIKSWLYVAEGSKSYLKIMKNGGRLTLNLRKKTIFGIWIVYVQQKLTQITHRVAKSFLKLTKKGKKLDWFYAYEHGQLIGNQECTTKITQIALEFRRYWQFVDYNETLREQRIFIVHDCYATWHSCPQASIGKMKM